MPEFIPRSRKNGNYALNSPARTLPEAALPGTIIRMIVTIDGPAGAGKSTVAKALARRLGYCHLDTGAMYRAVALGRIASRRGLEQSGAVGRAGPGLNSMLLMSRVYLEGKDVTEAVRTQEVTAVTRYAANHPQVRAHLVALQRAVADGKDIVAEGRDQGTVVFPLAQCKIFLTASPEERARRRQCDLQQRGEWETLEQILAAQERRDYEDATREVGPLVRAADAVEVLTDGLTQEQVVDRLEKLVRSRTG